MRLPAATVAVLMWSCHGSATVVDTGTTSGAVESWRGLEPVRLELTGLREMLEKANLYQQPFYNELRSALVDSLRSAGIPLLPESKWSERPEAPSLVFTGNYSRVSSGMMSLHVSATLLQTARVSRESFTQNYRVTTWSAEQSFGVGYPRDAWRKTYHAVLGFAKHVTRASVSGNAKQ